MVGSISYYHLVRTPPTIGIIDYSSYPNCGGPTLADCFNVEQAQPADELGGSLISLVDSLRSSDS
jgi:hypothetical protein